MTNEQRDSNADKTAISQPVSKNGACLTKAQFQAEKQYEAFLAIAKMLLDRELLTRDEYVSINTCLMDKYKPPLGAFFSQNNLL